MSRAGREPAEDVKRRLVCACQEEGLSVCKASMHLMKDAGVRLIYVGASVPNWPHEIATVSIVALVELNGRWPETVDIRCVASDRDPMTVNGPWMQGRNKVPFRDLASELRATLEERERVLGAQKSGLAGPYRFESTTWDTVDPLRLKKPF